MQLDSHLIDEIITRNDIIEVLSQDLKLKKSGPNYVSLCPFHNEKSPSFTINPARQLYHCFGCGESGTVINYIMKQQGLEFLDAIEILANRAGIYLPKDNVKKSKAAIKATWERKQTTQEVLKQVVSFYQNNLLHSTLATKYLENRGLSLEIIQKFMLGFTQNSKSNLSNPLASIFKDYESNNILIETGLVIQKDNNTRFDRFKDRIIFPIRNVKGEVIAFGGRIIARGEPKYLNSPETPLFNKSQELYGLYEAGKSIRTENFVIVVEGYMDVIALAQYGVTNVVASMGTALTADHIKKLFRLCDDIYYCFDGDLAGKKAAWRALERSISIVTDNKATHFCFLPKEHDPDSFIRATGHEKFKSFLKNDAVSMSNFLITQLTSEVNINSDEGLARLISLAKPYIEQTKAVALQVMLKRQLAKVTELEPGVIESILNNKSRYAFYKNNAYKGNNLKQAPARRLPPPNINIMRLIIKSAIKNVKWVIDYNLPEVINHYSLEIQELIFLLDFISNNYSDGEIPELGVIKENYEYTTLNLEEIFTANNLLSLNEEEFRQYLDKLLGLSQRKIIKIPQIPLKDPSI